MFQSSSQSAQMSGPPFDIEGMLYEMSMARGQMGRQLSNGSSSQRPRSSRISKPSSAGNSPQHLQRRRTSASHKMARYRSDLYPLALQIPQQNPPTAHPHQIPSHLRVRPVSWHPSTVGTLCVNGPAHALPVDPPYRHSMADYHTVAINGMPTPMTQPDLNVDVPSEPWFNLSDAPSSHLSLEQPITGYHDYTSAGLRLDSTFQSGFPMDPNAAYTMSALPSDTYSNFSHASFSTQTWTESLSAFPAYTAPPTPDFLPIQRHQDPAVEQVEVLLLPRKDSTELIGMGLYDDHSSMGMGSLIGGGRPDMLTRPESMGKGLKLEETWEPPEEEDESEDDEDEAEGEDDDEEMQKEEEAKVEEVKVVEPSKEMRNSTGESGSTTEAFREMYGDMSNQSFLFDSDDNYAGMGAEQSMLGMALIGQQGVVVSGGLWR